MNKLRLLNAVWAVLFTFIAASANAALVSRLGGQAAYDSVLGITWLTDAGLSGVNNWDNQLVWVSSLNTANYLGYNDWRLASMSVSKNGGTGTTTSVVDCSSKVASCQDNELGYMFYKTLGGNPGDDLTGNQTVGGVTLTNIQSEYWSGTEFDTSRAWKFNFQDGSQSSDIKDGGKAISGTSHAWAWAVRSGDVSAVPVPGAVWLFGSGLMGLLGLMRRKC